MDWTRAGQWTFEPLDSESFPAVALARAVGKAGGCLPAIYNAANEEAVGAFLSGRLGFLDIAGVVEETLAAHAPDNGLDLDAVLAAERWARATAADLITASAN